MNASKRKMALSNYEGLFGEKTIKLENRTNLTVAIPKESSNINVIKKEEGKSIDLDEANIKIERDGKVEEGLSTNLLTGNIIGSSESNWIRALTTWIKDITITGRAVEETTNPDSNLTLIIEEQVQEV